MAVEYDEVRLYMDCGEAERTTFQRTADKLSFSHNSGIFVANAGSTGLHRFLVSAEEDEIPGSFLLTTRIPKEQQ